MRFNLETEGYKFDAGARVWMREGFSGIKYNDGDEVELRIAKIVDEADDRSLFSPALATKCSDWPTRYHLSAARANILRPFEHRLGGKILEIGAGCGAITRYLGEVGGEVLALEGSPRRAAIAASRTRDLGNVHIVAEQFDRFTCDAKFDVITLIGVLEYANLFSQAPYPALAMLERIRSMLAPGGLVLLAIENQLGLKYFAGAPEDHIGKAMYGIEGRYRPDQPQTFGRAVLQALVEQAGFIGSEILVPLPDYKFPVSVLTPEGLSDHLFDGAAFAWQSARRDPQLPARTNFALELAWPQIFENDLGCDLANSFLLAATATPQELTTRGTLAFHYSTDRRPEFCKETRFIRDVHAGISVNCRRLATSATPSDSANQEFRFRPVDIDRYTGGETLSQDFVRLVTTPGWSVEQVGAFLRQYCEALNVLLAHEGHTPPLQSSHDKLPGSYLDSIPQNIIVRANGGPVRIDSEWQVVREIELGYLAFRSVLWLTTLVSQFASTGDGGAIPCRQFIEGACMAAGLPLSAADIQRYLEMEAAFQEFATGRPTLEFLQHYLAQPLPGLGAAGEFGVKVYFALPGDGYAEDKTVEARVPFGQGKSVVELTLPEHAQTGSTLRFDPADRQGCYRISQLALTGPAGQSLWSWDFDTGSLANTHGIVFLGKDIESASQLIYARDDDPHLVLALPEPVQDAVGVGSVLRVTIEALGLEEALTGLGTTDRAASEADPIAQELAHIHRIIGDRDTQMSVLVATISQGNDTISGLYKGWMEGKANAERFHHELADELAQLRKMIGDQGAQRLALEATVARGNDTITGLYKALMESKANAERFHHELAEEQAQLRRMIGDRDTQRLALEATITQGNDTISDLYKALMESKANAERLYQELAARSVELCQLHDAVRVKDGRIVELAGSVDERERIIAKNCETLATRDSEISSLKQNISEHAAAIRKIEESLVWRMAKPFRIALEKLNKGNPRSRTKV